MVLHYLQNIKYLQMARVSRTTIILTLMLAAFLAISAAKETRTCKKNNEFCGGIAGFQCCKGLECILEGDFPDAGGKCQKQSCQKLGQDCGGFRIEPLECCKGFTCVIKNPEIPDIGGTCQRSY